VVTPSYPSRPPPDPGEIRRVFPHPAPHRVANELLSDAMPRSGLEPSTVCGVSQDALPPDPFAGDPHDPARTLDDPPEVNELEPLSAEDRAEIVEDLSDLAVYQALLEGRGIRGVVVDCPDCGEQHYHEWNLLRASLRQLLEEGQMRRHEPAFDPDPADYVTWEYCRGYADAMLNAD